MNVSAVRYWPKAGMCECTANVRFWGVNPTWGSALQNVLLTKADIAAIRPFSGPV